MGHGLRHAPIVHEDGGEQRERSRNGESLNVSYCDMVDDSFCEPESG
jgi:hypothetical protein